MTSTYPGDTLNYDCRKKFRTQISNNQVKVLKCIFEVYKMPAMSECQIMADFVGLQKRVVQVWFQNARAKEKKMKLKKLKSSGKYSKKQGECAEFLRKKKRRKPRKLLSSNTRKKKRPPGNKREIVMQRVMSMMIKMIMRMIIIIKRFLKQR